MKQAVLTIPENIQGMDMQTNGVHSIVIVNALNIMQKHFARLLVQEAERAVGKDRVKQEEYLRKMTRRYINDGTNPDEWVDGLLKGL